MYAKEEQIQMMFSLSHIPRVSAVYLFVMFTTALTSNNFQRESVTV